MKPWYQEEQDRVRKYLKQQEVTKPEFVKVPPKTVAAALAKWIKLQ